MKRKEWNMLQGPLAMNILLYTLPIILTSYLQLLFNAADLVVVGRFCGSVAVAAVGVTGALTKVGNRQALRMAFQEMENQQEQRFFLAMMDLDDFKSLNDTFGHSQGDQYLRALGLVLNGISTEKVLPFRFGGDEFCVLFCGCDPEEVREICDRVRRGFQKAKIHQTCREVSISIGVAEYRQGEKPVQLLDRADAALYQAKQEKGSVHFG